MKGTKKKGSSTSTKTSLKEDQAVNIDSIKSLIQKDEELAKTMLAKLSGTENKTTKKIEQKYDFLQNLSKPPWVENVKEIHSTIIDDNVEKKEDIPVPMKQVSSVRSERQEDEEEEELSNQYPLYVSIKRIAYANGDYKKPNKESIIALHKFLEAVSDALLDRESLNKYMDHDKKSGKGGDRTNKNKANKFKKFLQSLFPQEYYKFFSFNKITKNLKNLENEIANEDQLDEQKFYDSENESEEEISFKLINSNLKDEEKAAFNKRRLDNLNQEEYEYLMECRSTNFHKDIQKLTVFVDPEARGIEFVAKNKSMVEFVSYILCKQIGTLIENIVRGMHQGLLKEITEPIPSKQIEQECEKGLNHIKSQIKKIIRETVSIEEIAFKVFQKEFHEIKFNPHGEKPEKQRKLNDEQGTRKKAKQLQTEDQNEEEKDTDQHSKIQAAWKKLGPTGRKQWIDRIIAEKQIKDLIFHPEQDIDSWDDINPANCYSNFLISIIQDIPDKKSIDDNKLREYFHKYINNETFINPLPDGEYDQMPLMTQKLSSQSGNGNSNTFEMLKSNNSKAPEQIIPERAPDMNKVSSNTSNQGNGKRSVQKKRRLESIFD